MTSLGLAEVPVAVLLDEHGVVQKIGPRPKEISKLVAEQRKARTEQLAKLNDQWTDPDWILAQKDKGNWQVESLILAGDEYLKKKKIPKAISCYKEFIETTNESTSESEKQLIPSAYFRLGVANRALFDSSPKLNGNNFVEAATSWTMAHDGNPNQYIWRRRIEQYGPRQIKPYPFYNWVDEAIAEIQNRGEKPVEQKVQLTASELATPSKTTVKAEENKNPDPDRKIAIADVEIEHIATLVPSRIKLGQTSRVHLQFNSGTGFKWNNESSPMLVWINETDQGESSKRLIEIPNADQATSSEPRTIEFDFQSSKDAKQASVSGFALFNICSDEGGVCMYRRFDFKVDISLSQ